MKPVNNINHLAAPSGNAETTDISRSPNSVKPGNDWAEVSRRAAEDALDCAKHLQPKQSTAARNNLAAPPRLAEKVNTEAELVASLHKFSSQMQNYVEGLGPGTTKAEKRKVANAVVKLLIAARDVESQAIQAMDVGSYQFRDLIRSGNAAARARIDNEVEWALEHFGKKFGFYSELGDDYEVTEVVRSALIQLIEEQAEEDARKRAGKKEEAEAESGAA